MSRGDCAILAGIESIWCKRVSVVTVTKLQNKEREGSRSVFTFSIVYIYLFLLAFFRSLMEGNRVVGKGLSA